MKLRVITPLAVLLLALFSQGAAGQWSASPGDTVRNAFGPQKGQSAPACRGACGMDCPSSCDQDVRYECAGDDKLRRVDIYQCGTHQACRDHDDCLDRCLQEQAEGYDCQTYCHTDVMNLWPPENAISWAAGGGPYDGAPINFEYTMQRPGDPEASYRCPEGSELQCADAGAECRDGNRSVDPVFETYEGGGAVWVTDFRSGKVCTENGQPGDVCEPAVDIAVRGEDQCPQAGGPQACTWYGFEFLYHGAMPGEPLFCESSGTPEDFLGGVVSKGLESMDADEDTELGAFLSGIQKGLESGESLDSVLGGITVTTEDGQTVGGTAQQDPFPKPGVPNEVAINSSSGYLVVPIFELRGASPAGESVEHHIRCKQGGVPVIETTFRLHFARN